jgi:uncharacterized protein
MLILTMPLKLRATLSANTSALKQTIIIAAISSRIYLQAAVEAGFDVIVMDAFCDVDSQKLAKKTILIPLINGQLDAKSLLKQLLKLDLSKVLGLCYGAGFEAQTELLSQLAVHVKVIGNVASTVKNVNNIQDFFQHCDALKMPYPKTQFERPRSSINWLQKQIGGSGGAHIRPALPLDLPANDTNYYQQLQAGTPISCLFLADSKNAQVIGFNEQLCNGTAILPYRYGGVVSHVLLSEKVKIEIEQFVQGMTKIYGLVGLNSADFIVDNEVVYALEINPRLSASLDCYRAKKGDLFAAHVAACAGDLKDWPIVDKQSRAHFVVYAHEAVTVPPNMCWPEWVRDIPLAGADIAAGEPICTVLADARTAKRAKQKLFLHVRDL